jgi:hypothetical protein
MQDRHKDMLEGSKDTRISSSSINSRIIHMPGIIPCSRLPSTSMQDHRRIRHRIIHTSIHNNNIININNNNSRSIMAEE